LVADGSERRRAGSGRVSLAAFAHDEDRALVEEGERRERALREASTPSAG
jgi:hypothetical protein